MERPDLTRRTLLKQGAAGGLALAAGAMVTLGCSRDVSEEALKDAGDVIQKAAGSPAQPPNFILINADDLGYGDVGCYGGRAIRTPHIDSLAEQGVRFTDFHACDSVCTPSRAGLLTGRYPKRMGLDVPLQPEKLSLQNTLMFPLAYLSGKLGVLDLASEDAASGLCADEITLAQALKVRDYATGMVGKWHLGDYRSNPEHNPRRHGFDEYFGVPYSNDMHPFPLYRNEDLVEADVADQAKLTGLYTKEATRFIESSRDKPFLLYFAHTFPHRPLYASKSFENRSSAGIFGDTVEEVDWSVGQVLSTLQRYNLQDNTLVMFTSDNGPWYQGSPGLFRGRKGQSYEGGHRVPFVARFPGKIPPGMICRQPAMNIDLFPTCLALSGLSLPSDRIIDGRNIHRLLTVPDSESPHESLFFYHHGELEGIREGRWKYFRSINHYVWPMPVNKSLGKLSEHTTGPLPLLFDLDLDPGEAYNVAEKYPEVAQRLAEQMARWDEEMQQDRRGWRT